MDRRLVEALREDFTAHQQKVLDGIAKIGVAQSGKFQT
jgi:hypothetical protein